MMKILKKLLLLTPLLSFICVEAKVNYLETYNMNRAKEEAEKGNYKDAADFYEKELKEHPDNGYAEFFLAVIEYANNEFDNVFPRIDKALKNIPKKDKEQLSLVYSLRGDVWFSMGDTISGLQDLNKGLRLDRDNKTIMETLGQIYYEKGNYDESDKNYQRLIELNPGDSLGHIGLGRNNFKRGNYDEAVKLYDKVVTMYPDYSSGYSYRAELKLQQEKYVETIDDIMKALEIDGNGKAHYLLSQFPDDKLPLVFTKLKGMQVKNPYEAIWPYYAAQLYMFKKNYPSAIEELNKAYEIDAHPIFLSMLADCYQELSDFNSALSYINKALEMQPDDLELLNSKADILGEAGNIEEALEVWSKFIELNPDFPHGYYRRGFFEDNDNRTDEALSDYDMAVMLKPDFAYAWLGKADMHLKKGEKEKALDSYRKVVELDTVPELGSCAMYALLALGEKEKGIDFMEKLLEKESSEPGVYYDAACFYSRLGNMEKSLSNLTLAMEKGYHKFHHIMADDDLEELRKTEGFKSLMNQYKDKIEKSKLKKSPTRVQIEDEGIIENDIVEIPFTPENGCVSVKCNINELPLTFIFDTGASVVSMSQLEASFMLKNGYLKPSDFVGSGRFVDANGDVSEGSIINLKNVEFGGLNLTNVKASVVKNQKAPLLLGQSVLGRLGSIEIDNNNKKLIIRK